MLKFLALVVLSGVVVAVSAECEVPKPGFCPHIPAGTPGICIHGCSSDSNCKGDNKCCSTGCGTQCTASSSCEACGTGTDLGSETCDTNGRCVACPKLDCAMEPCTDALGQPVPLALGPDGCFICECFDPCKPKCVTCPEDEVCVGQRGFACVLSPCYPTPECVSRCILPADSGPCEAAMTRYFYNGKKCEKFIYGGCEGNANNFLSKRDCNKACQGNRRK